MTSCIPLNNTRTKKQNTNPTTTQLKCALLKKPKTQGKQKTLLSFTLLLSVNFGEERLSTGIRKFVNEKITKPKNPQGHHHPASQFEMFAEPQLSALLQSPLLLWLLDTAGQSLKLLKNAAKGSLSLRTGSTIPWLSLTHPSTNAKQTNWKDSAMPDKGLREGSKSSSCRKNSITRIHCNVL